MIITAFLVLIVCLACLGYTLGRALSAASTVLVRSAYRYARQAR